MTTLVKDQPSTSQTPDVFGMLKGMAEFGPEAGERLRAARDNLGLTQRDAAHLLHTTEKTLSKWETGKSEPTRLGAWNRIEKIYGVTRREIVGEPEPAQLDRMEQEIRALNDKLEQLLNALVLPSERETAERLASGESVPRPKLPSQRSTPRSKSSPRNRRAGS